MHKAFEMGVVCGCNQWDAVNWSLMDKTGITAVSFFPPPHYEHLKRLDVAKPFANGS